MKLDTLILSGGSTKVSVYVGIFRALFEKKLITNSLDGISHIVTCSVGMLPVIYILLDIPLHVQEEAVLHADFTKLLDSPEDKTILPCLKERNIESELT